MDFHPEHFTVWVEIPSSDVDQAVPYYEAVLMTKLEKTVMGPDTTFVFKTATHPDGISGHVYPGKPAGDGSGPTIHLAAPGKLEDTLDRVRAAGGTVISDPIPFPFGRFAYTTDLDGNSIGLFEPASQAA
ncbi:MAG: VOC family protein [Pseudomonadota bacterium]